jgi:hypothetical protein
MHKVGKRLGGHQKSSSLLEQLDLSFTFASAYHAVFRIVRGRALPRSSDQGTTLLAVAKGSWSCIGLCRSFSISPAMCVRLGIVGPKHDECSMSSRDGWMDGKRNPSCPGSITNFCTGLMQSIDNQRNCSCGNVCSWGRIRFHPWLRLVSRTPVWTILVLQSKMRPGSSAIKRA